jgi:hypothetical protein
VPLPSKIETLSELTFAAARSVLLSALKSPVVTERGASPAPKVIAGAKLGVAQPLVHQGALHASLSMYRIHCSNLSGRWGLAGGFTAPENTGKQASLLSIGVAGLMLSGNGWRRAVG